MKIENEVMYGISIDGRKPSTWSEEYPDLTKLNLNFDLLYKSVEIIKKSVTYQPVTKIR